MDLEAQAQLLEAQAQLLENLRIDGENGSKLLQDPPGVVILRNGDTVSNLRKRLEDVGYSVPVAFTSGLSVTEATQTVTYEGEVYAANPSAIPFTTTSTFDANQWYILARAEAKAEEFRNIFNVTSPSGQNQFTINFNPIQASNVRIKVHQGLITTHLYPEAGDFSLSGTTITTTKTYYPPSEVVIEYRVPALSEAIASTNVQMSGALDLEQTLTQVDKRQPSNLTTLLADATYTYTDNAIGSVTQGLILPCKDGTQFEVAASNATDHDYTTTGGVKLYEIGPNFSTRAAAEKWFARLTANSVAIPVGYVITWPTNTLKYDGTTNLYNNFDGWTWGIQGEPLILTGAGQSNRANVRTNYPWTPSENVFYWNATGTGTGDAFTEAPNDRMSYMLAFGDEMAKAHPDRPVFIIETGRPGLPIDNWLPSPPTYDVYTLMDNRITAALSYIGESTISMIDWQQGESDSSDTLRPLYDGKYQTLYDRWVLEPWFPDNCPIRINGVVSTQVNGSPDYRNMNIVLQKVAWRPNHTFFMGHEVLTGAAGGTDWLDGLHPTGLGYEKQGRASARDYLSGSNRYLHGIVFDPETVAYGFGKDTTAGVPWDFSISEDEDVVRRLRNPNTGASARAVDVIESATGTFTQRAWGSTASGRFEQTWSGTSAWQQKAANAVGGFQWFAGSTEDMRLTGGLWRLTLDGTEQMRVTSSAATVYEPLVLNSHLQGLRQTSDPADPVNNSFVIWMADGSGAGSDGDIMVKITSGSTTKTATLVDFSAV